MNKNTIWISWINPDREFKTDRREGVLWASVKEYRDKVVLNYSDVYGETYTEIFPNESYPGFGIDFEGRRLYFREFPLD